MASPAVTVLLPVHNAQEWLPAALASVSGQSFGDFELLAIDDGSTDASPTMLQSCRDARLRVVRQERNQGLVASLNRGIELARGRYVARMDADDLAHPRRLEHQARYLDAHPEVGVCGTWYWLRQGTRRTHVRVPVGHDEIVARLFFRSAFGHPTVMLRRELLLASGLRYDAAALHAEDFDLWVRLREHTRFANLPRYLLEYRLHPRQVSSEQLRPQLESAARVRLQQLQRMVPDASAAERELHLRVCDGHVFTTRADLLEARAWLDRLQAENRKAALFPSAAFGDALANTWTHCCFRTAMPARQVMPVYLGRRYSRLGAERLREYAVFAVRALRCAR